MINVVPAGTSAGGVPQEQGARKRRMKNCGNFLSYKGQAVRVNGASGTNPTEHIDKELGARCKEAYEK